MQRLFDDRTQLDGLRPGNILSAKGQDLFDEFLGT